MTTQELIEEFQCPGCTCGMNIECGAYNLEDEGWHVCCEGHVLGTFIGAPNNAIALGLPKGFHKPGSDQDGKIKIKMDIRLWKAETHPKWNKFNIPIWAMEKDGFLFVRTYAPRINKGWVDVIEGGNFDLVPGAMNVAEFLDEID